MHYTRAWDMSDYNLRDYSREMGLQTGRLPTA